MQPMASPPQSPQGLQVRLASPEAPDPEPIGGLLALESEELALGSADDYGIEEIDALPADDDTGEAPIFGLSVGFGERAQVSDVWDVADLQELVVNETRGQFDADGDGRKDAYVMEEEWDPSDTVVLAVWKSEHPGGKMSFAPRIRRHRSHRHLLPYGMIAAGLGAAAVVGLVGIAALGLVTVMAGSRTVIAPLDRSKIPVVEYERKVIVPQTPEEILDEVLGEKSEE